MTVLCGGLVHRCVSSQLDGVVCRKQAALPPQPPRPPGAVGAIQHLDDVAGEKLQLVPFLRFEVVERLHLHRGGKQTLIGGGPLWEENKLLLMAEARTRAPSLQSETK